MLAAAGFIAVRVTGLGPSALHRLGHTPVVLAAYLYGRRGAAAIAGSVAFLLGPAAALLGMPGGADGPQTWLLRGSFFVAVGGISGGLFNRFRQKAETIESREREIWALIEDTSDALVVADSEGRCIAANSAACVLFGVPLDSLIGSRLGDFVRDSDALATIGSECCETVVVRPDGREITVECSGSGGNVPGRHLTILRDVTARKETQAQLERLVLFDPLPDLPNATLQRDRLRLAVRQARQTGTEVALVHLGVNGFKAMNEALGRSTGDRVLQVIGERLLAVTREGDSVARLVGDEFAVILATPVTADSAWQAAGRALLAVAQPMELANADHPAITLEASAGLAIFPSDADDETDLLRAADLALHSAKRRGIGLAVYTGEQDERARTRWARLMELREALRGEQLLLYYQPVFRARDLGLISAEALVRWQHPAKGLLGPDEFVPLAEGAGLVDDLAIWVLRQATRQVASWKAAGRELVTAVNLSALNLRDASIVDQFASMLGEKKLDPALMKVEITETALMTADPRAIHALEELRGRGLRVAMDDFGTGYSSLGALRSMPIDEIKLDRSFVSRTLDDGVDRRIVGTIIDLAHDLGLQVIAEGVEDAATLTLLREMGCDAIQGYLTGRPVPPDDLRRPPASRRRAVPASMTSGPPKRRQ
jgi:diguanylate cyclase (GGDEF)-like protein/PAS domain S-box-containing protein